MPRLLLLSGAPDAATSARLAAECGFDVELVEDAAQALARLETGDAAGLVSGVPLTEGDLDSLEASLEQVAGELEGSLGADLGGEVATLHLLHRFAVELNAAESLPEVAQLAARAAYDLLGGHGVHVQLWDDGVRGGCVEADAGPEMSADMHGEKLEADGRVLGEIVVDLRGPRGARLAERDLEVLGMIALPAALAVRSIEGRRLLESAQQRMVLAMARLAEGRDACRGRHIERVGQYSRLIAEGLAKDGHYRDTITPTFVDDLACASGLHDIGKVAVPDSILLKPGSLSQHEWDVMRTHAEVGADTIAEVLASGPSPGYLVLAEEITRSHHEKWDGSGYPRGIAGESIPLAARILALADVYDALTTRRPYKDAWSHTRAVEWIRDLSGSHFDPKVVECFVLRAQDVDDIRARLADTDEEAQRALLVEFGA